MTDDELTRCLADVREWCGRPVQLTADRYALALCDEVKRLVRERDEARAECERQRASRQYYYDWFVALCDGEESRKADAAESDNPFPANTMLWQAWRDGWRIADWERLRAIVDRLPKTADGVPITPGMNIWTREYRADNGPWACGVVAVHAVGEVWELLVRDAAGLEDTIDGDWAFSTREAAEAAGKEVSDG